MQPGRERDHLISLHGWQRRTTRQGDACALERAPLKLCDARRCRALLHLSPNGSSRRSDWAQGFHGAMRQVRRPCRGAEPSRSAAARRVPPMFSCRIPFTQRSRCEHALRVPLVEAGLRSADDAKGARRSAHGEGSRPMVGRQAMLGALLRPRGLACRLFPHPGSALKSSGCEEWAAVERLCQRARAER
jgi:hypothetical protein